MQRSRQRDELRELQDADGAATHPVAVCQIALSLDLAVCCDLVAYHERPTRPTEFPIARMLTPAKTIDKDSSAEAEQLVKAAVEKAAAHKAPDDIFASIDTAATARFLPTSCSR